MQVVPISNTTMGRPCRVHDYYTRSHPRWLRVHLSSFALTLAQRPRRCQTTAHGIAVNYRRHPSASRPPAHHSSERRQTGADPFIIQYPQQSSASAEPRVRARPPVASAGDMGWRSAMAGQHLFQSPCVSQLIRVPTHQLAGSPADGCTRAYNMLHLPDSTNTNKHQDAYFMPMQRGHHPIQGSTRCQTCARVQGGPEKNSSYSSSYPCTAKTSSPGAPPRAPTSLRKWCWGPCSPELKC